MVAVFDNNVLISLSRRDIRKIVSDKAYNVNIMGLIPINCYGIMIIT